jgi:iron complex outermembrane receptor protein
MRRKVVLGVFAALLAGGPLYAQTGQVTGSVTSSEGARPLSGASVSVAGTSLRAVTGADGRYTLAGVPAGTQRLTATTLGHAPTTLAVTVAAGQTATLNFTLSPTAVALQGVVAIGYGERRVRDVTGSVQAVSEDQFNTGRVVSPAQMIQGKIAGVQVIDNGEPGGSANIRIRGGTSVNASNEPLFVVDGVPLPTGGGLSSGRNPLNFINPRDISRVTVLKDASSTAIYGSRGANGVIIIETKNGSAREPAFSYSTSLSTSNVTRNSSLLSADQFRAAVQQYAPGRVQFLGSTSTDWRGAIERQGYGQEHALAIGGAGADMNYRLSLNYLKQSGVIRGSGTERMSAALNYNHRLFENRLNLRAALRGARTRDDYTPSGVLGAANNYDPTVPIRSGTGFFEEPFQLAPDNPLAQLAGVVDNGNTYRSIGNLEARYRMPFMEALTGTVRLGYDVAKSERRTFTPTDLHSQVKSTTPGSDYRANPTETTGVLDAFLNYNSRLGHSSEIDATGGYSFENTRGQYIAFTARGLSSNLLGNNGVPSAAEVAPFDSTRDSKLASFFGRVNYTLRDRYLLTLSLRRDGSSRFGPARQWGNFPAAALAWRVNEEPWFPGGTPISELKLRGSWGVNGNQSFPDYLWISSYRYSDAFARVQFGDEFVTTIRPTAVDPSIKWEETTSWNTGFDYGLFDDRLTGAVDFYVKNTKDLIFYVPVAAGSNLSNYVWTNIGTMNNRGLELSLNAKVLRGGSQHRGLTWDASFNASTNRNRLTSINPNAGGAQQILTGGISGGVGGTIQVFQPGTPVYAFYVLQARRGPDGKPVRDRNGTTTVPDTSMYVDLNGDGQITQDDRRPFHSPLPQWVLAHTSNFGYRSWDLGFTLRAQLGNYVYNNVASNQGYYGSLNNAAGLQNLHSSVLTYGFVDPQYYSDVYVENASFLRMDNITLGYTLPRLRGVSQARIFATVQNAFTITGYSGVDPEAVSGPPPASAGCPSCTGPSNNGIDNNIYPRSRTFSAGVTLAF